MSNDSSEKLFSLSDGRLLAYDQNGDSNSSTVVVFLHGAFGIGNAQQMSPYLKSRGVHYITPTLPGWGRSSSIPPNQPPARQFVTDLNQLLLHLHPHPHPNLRLYICGGSYGTVFAQMVYGAPYDLFPMGKYLKGCLLAAPFSPFLHHKDAYKDMTWGNYLMIGPPARLLPFHLLQRTIQWVLSRKLSTLESSERFVRQLIFDKMDEREQDMFRAWSERMGKQEGQFQREMARMMHQSISQNWDGFCAIADVSAGDWGYDPTALDEEHAKCKVIVLASKQDDMAPISLARYLARTYRNTQLIEVDGGHIAGLYRLEDTWAVLLDA